MLSTLARSHSEETSLGSLVKIFKQYGNNAIATVTHNPYQLAVDIYGIGFLTADKIARNLGVSPWSKSRYSAGILHILGQAADDGHCFLPQSLLIDTALELLTIEEHQTEVEGIVGVLNEMVGKGELIVEVEEEPIYYKPSFFHTEQNLAKLLKQHLANTEAIDLNRVRNWLGRFTKSQNLELSSQQQQPGKR